MSLRGIFVFTVLWVCLGKSKSKKFFGYVCGKVILKAMFGPLSRKVAVDLSFVIVWCVCLFSTFGKILFDIFSAFGNKCFLTFFWHWGNYLLGTTSVPIGAADYRLVCMCFGRPQRNDGSGLEE